jgi:DNA-binding transcriptional LysR family regulator
MDMGVVACPERHRSIEVIPLASEDLVVVCSPSHRLAERSVNVPKDLDGQEFVGFEANIPTRRFIDRLLKNQQVHVRVIMQFDNVELLKRAVEVGSAISILPAENVRREVERGDLALAHFKNSLPWRRPVAVIRRRGKAPTPAEKMFLGILREDIPETKPQ